MFRSNANDTSFWSLDSMFSFTICSFFIQLLVSLKESFLRMHGPIYHNLPQPGNCYQQERIYQNVTGPPRAVRRTDSSLKRKIARKHSFQNQTGPPVDQAAASAVSELLKSINFPSMSRRENYELVPPQNRQPKQPSRFTTNSLPRNRSEGDLLQRLDPFKLEAVLRFMEANQIDPFTPPEPRGLRRIQSERHLTRSVQPTQSGYYNSMERVPKDKKRKKSFFNWGDGLISVVDYIINPFFRSGVWTGNRGEAKGKVQ